MLVLKSFRWNLWSNVYNSAVYILLYADDAVLTLQTHLGLRWLANYCRLLLKQILTMRSQKLMVFPKGKAKWTSVMGMDKYLGILFHESTS